MYCILGRRSLFRMHRFQLRRSIFGQGKVRSRDNSSCLWAQLRDRQNVGLQKPMAEPGLRRHCSDVEDFRGCIEVVQKVVVYRE